MPRSPKTSPLQRDGVLVLYKPKGPSSTFCVNSIKRTHRQVKIGHLGTLDPMAEGVLPVLLGQATKLASFLEFGDKIYKGSFILGKETDTYDAEGRVVSESSTEGISVRDVAGLILDWRNATEQIVPPVSAAKHQGKPLYKLARQGGDVPVKTKRINISRAEFIADDFPRFDFRIGVSAGTYVRSLVHSLGKRLGCGAVLTALVREKSGPFEIGQSCRFDEVLTDFGCFERCVLSLRKVAGFMPQYLLDEEQAQRVKNGVRLPLAETSSVNDGCPDCGAYTHNSLLLAPDHVPLAVAQAISEDGIMKWSILRGLWRD